MFERVPQEIKKNEVAIMNTNLKNFIKKNSIKKKV